MKPAQTKNPCQNKPESKKVDLVVMGTSNLVSDPPQKRSIKTTVPLLPNLQNKAKKTETPTLKQVSFQNFDVVQKENNDHFPPKTDMLIQ